MKNVEIKIGEWYKNNLCGGSLFCLIKVNHHAKLATGYGFENNIWINNAYEYYWGMLDIEIATDLEIQIALVKEAKYRYPELNNKQQFNTLIYKNKALKFCHDNYEQIIFKDGIWADHIFLPSNNKKNINTNNLNIMKSEAELELEYQEEMEANALKSSDNLKEYFKLDTDSPYETPIYTFIERINKKKRSILFNTSKYNVLIG